MREKSIQFYFKLNLSIHLDSIYKKDKIYIRPIQKCTFYTIFTNKYVYTYIYRNIILTLKCE